MNIGCSILEYEHRLLSLADQSGDQDGAPPAELSHVPDEKKSCFHSPPCFCPLQICLFHIGERMPSWWSSTGLFLDVVDFVHVLLKWRAGG
ncbi:hypothetical protein COLO4_28347 [Corchorus olitorius]|uniref:Uncharacterized protein n=1 Tax=Corchorus olitorius TaxID=93759 RepID=A0A1R3HLG8_9ROSI|nr:hypothetical protein COLO4_28347 [Corchorus olitorius]